GSWNRTRKDGYKVVSLHWSGNDAIVDRDFLTGFLQDEDVIGRPVDVAEGPDGAVYVSDDYGGSVYRIAWGGRASAASPEASTPAVSIPAPVTLPPEAIARGRALYARHECAQCHDRRGAAPH